MGEPLSRRDALEVLELEVTADADTVKTAYRRLALRHHPDAGGDVATFQLVQRAYERLHAGVDVGVGRSQRPRPPTRPSRAPGDRAGPAAEDLARTEQRLARIDWQAPPPGPGASADVTGLALALTRRPAPAVSPVALVSRGPQSRLNRLAPHLSGDLTARLAVSVTDDHRATVGQDIEIRLEANGRKVRRHLDQAPLDGGWLRERGSSWTRVLTFVAPGPDPRRTAIEVVTHIDGLLGHLDWPLSSWSFAA